MPKQTKPSDPWYDVLNIEEAKEVSELDSSIEHLDGLRKILIAKRGRIRTRAQMRLIYNREKEKQR